MNYFVLKKLVLSFILSLGVIALIVFSFKADYVEHQKSVELQRIYNTQIDEVKSISIDLYIVQKLLEQAKGIFQNFVNLSTSSSNKLYQPIDASTIDLIAPAKVNRLSEQDFANLLVEEKSLLIAEQQIKPIAESILKQRLVEQAFVVGLTDKRFIFPTEVPVATDPAYRQLFNWIYHKQDQLSKLTPQKHSIFVPPFFDRKFGKASEFIILPISVVDNTMAILIVKVYLELAPTEGLDDFSYIVWDSATGKTITTNIEDPSGTEHTTAQVYLATRYLPAKLQYFAGSGRNVRLTDKKAKLIDSDDIPYIYLHTEIESTPYKIILFKQAQSFLQQIDDSAQWFLLKIALFSLFSVCFIFGLLVWKLAYPTAKLIEHIEQQSSLYEIEERETIKGWEKWFDKVALAYKDNRKLLQSLMTKNKHLDHIVQSRTQELEAQTSTKDRNIALNRSIMNSIPDMIYYKNLDGGFLGCNSAFEYFAGMSETDIVARHADDIFDLRTAEEINKFDFQALKSKRPFTGKSRHIFPNGRDAIIQWLVAPIVDTDGEVHGLLGLGRDITEQEASVQKIDQARKQAVVANETKSHFIANMSHEIRTPMNAIMGMLELLTSSRPSVEQSNYIGIAQTSSRHLIQIINDILDFAKVSANKIELHKEVFAFSSVVDIAFANSLPDALKKNLLLDVNMSRDFPELFVGDEVRIAQVLINLIGNAVKFTESGAVTVEANLLNDQEAQQLIELKVTDTGVGIPQEKQQAVFEAFTQADSSITREFGGTGLGLTIVYQLVKLMGGKTELWSKVGEGTEFKVTMTLGKVSEQTDNQYIQRHWVICDGEPIYVDSLKRKLRSTKQQYRVLNPAELENGRFTDNEVLICRPETLTLLSAELVERIACGKLELQPVTFKLNELASNCLFTIPHFPVLSMPFTTNRLMLNQLQPKVMERKVDVSLPLLDTYSILVIEDNEVNQQVLELILSNEGAAVTCADNGQVGLDLLNQHTYDVVILDLQMPVMDGITCTKAIRANLKLRTMPIIAMTAHNAESDRQNTKAAGVDVHLNKPIEKDKLLAAIHKLAPDKLSLRTESLSTPVSELNIGTLNKRFENLDWQFLAKQFGNDFSTVSTLLNRFKESKQKALTNLASNYRIMEHEELKALFHNYKGMFGSIGATRLSSLAAKLEGQLGSKSGLSDKTMGLFEQEVVGLFSFIEQLETNRDQLA